VRGSVDLDTEVEVAMRLFDDIERLVEDPTAKEVINVLLERIGLRVGFFEDGKKGTRTVRTVAKGVIALGDLPLPKELLRLVHN